MERHHARRVDFLGSFMLNAVAPVNFAWTNPAVLETAWRTAGANFVAGASLLAQDFIRLARGEKLKGLDDFKIGENIAVTEGKVVFRNELIELIQYAPTTPQVREEPLLIVPGLDHEILCSRSQPRKFPGALSGRPGIYGVHDLLEEPRCRAKRHVIR